jgi:ribosomal protein L11 methyltransferase
VTIPVTPDDYESAVGRALALSPAGLAEEDGYLIVYTDPAGAESLRKVFADVEIEPVAPGWEDEWRRFHVPVTVGPLWIGPPWHEPAADAIPVVIDPGRAFGTGAHETTRLCLELLLDVPRGALLDAGCGSGVIAIAAAKLGFGPVVALDLEAASVDATARNAAANDVELEILRADVLVDELPQVDVAVANLTLEAVEELGARVDARHIVTSGYLTGDEPRLPGFRHLERRAGERFAADLHARE